MQMKYAIFLVFLFFLIHDSQAQESLSKDISYAYLEKLITVCKTNYPKVKMYEARINVAEMGIKKAKLSYFDILSFSYVYSPTNNTAPLTDKILGGYQFGFFANIGSLVQKPSVIKQSKSEFAAAQFDKEAFDLSMEAEVKKRYYVYVQKVVSLRLRSGSLLDVENMLSNIKHRFEKGEENIENYNKILVMHSDHLQNIINAESEMLVAKSSLEELLGQTLENIK